MSNCNPIDKNILEGVIHRIPGNPVQSKKEKQGYVDLCTKTKPELLELIERQNKLLNKKGFINSLPDKGEKITKYKTQLEEELRNRDKSDELSNMLLELNIHGKEAIDKLEWTGKCNPGQCTNAIENNIEDNDSNDPLKIFATHSGTVSNQRINRILPPEPSLIKPSDIEDGEEHFEINQHPTSVNGSSLEIDEPYVKALCDKFDKFSSKKPQEKFLPHRTLKLHKEVNSNEQKPKNPFWEVTAATPPPSVYNNVKLIPLETSVKLQIQQAEKLKEIQMKHATEKLKTLSGKGIGNGNWLLSGNTSQLRNPRTHYESSSNSSDEDNHDSYHSCNEEEDADEKRGGVTFYNLIDN